MARYKKVDVRVWADQKFLELSRPHACGQALWWRLMTPRESTNLPGLFSAGELGLAEQMGWSLKGFRKAWKEIADRKMAIADWRTGTIFLFNGIKYHEPENPNVITSWKAPWDEIPESSVKWAAYLWLRLYIQNRYDKPTFLKAFDLACPEPTPRQFSVEFVAGLPERLTLLFMKEYSKWFPEELKKVFGESGAGAGAVTGTGTGAGTGTRSPLPDLSIPKDFIVRTKRSDDVQAINFKNLWTPVEGYARTYLGAKVFEQHAFGSCRIVELSGEHVTLAVPEILIRHQGSETSTAQWLLALIAQARTGLMRGRNLKLITIEKLVQDELGGRNGA